jgi:hypothetical protein
MYTVELPLPPAICLAIDSALLMGMAKPRVPPDDLARVVCQRAARVALLDRRVGLQHVIQVLGAA